MFEIANCDLFKIMVSKESQEENLIIFEEIENKIYNIRGERVMLDSDLAEIYGVENESFETSRAPQFTSLSNRFYV